jgi:hypothetical protein
MITAFRGGGYGRWRTARRRGASTMNTFFRSAAGIFAGPIRLLPYAVKSRWPDTASTTVGFSSDHAGGGQQGQAGDKGDQGRVHVRRLVIKSQ